MADKTIQNEAALSKASLDFDPEFLRKKYEQEREKRVRSDGISQYRRIDREFPGFASDPFKPVSPRDAISEQIEVLIVGAGIGGLLMASHLLSDLDTSRIRMIDRAGDFGGTWYWNRYPGAQCDIDSYIYLPALEATRYIPKEKYAYQPEILEHCRRVGETLGMRERALFHTVIKAIAWDESTARWQVRTDRDDLIQARHVVLSTGPLDKAKLPGIPGIEDYHGHVFHTSRWDYKYTGDSLENLGNKRVAVIGTGASAIQCVPFLAEAASELLVFQRTPAIVNPRGNMPTPAGFEASCKPGWQQTRMENYTAHALGLKNEEDEDLVQDGWTFASHRLFNIFGADGSEDQTNADAEYQAELADYIVMNDVRHRVDSLVSDPGIAESLKPWYRFFCKRPLFNDEYLPSFNRANVKLVDTDGRGVDRIDGDAIVVGNDRYPVDCIIFATGFEVGSDYAQRVGFEIAGRTGQTLSEHWKDGFRTMHGIMSHNFPNLYFLGSGQVGFTLNFQEMADKQGAHISWLIDQAVSRGLQAIEPTSEAEQQYLQIVIDAAQASLEFQKQCTPSYFNNEGQPVEGGKGIIDGQYAGGLVEWWRILSEWRDQGDMDGMVLR